MPATAITFNDIDSAFVSDVSQLPALNETRLKPNTSAIQKGYIKGYVDILGYTNTARINGQEYSNGVPVIRGNAWVQDTPPGIQDSFNYSISISNNTTTIVATITATLKWHTQYCDALGCFTNGRFISTEYFYDSEPLLSDLTNIYTPQLIVHEYTYPNKTVLETRIDDIITSFKVSNTNGSLTRHIQIGQVAYTEKGIPYANFTKALPIWKHAGTGIYQQGTDIVLENSNFTFTANTPFGNIIATPNISVVREQPTSISSFNLLMIIFLGIGYFACKLAVKI